jgi:3-carboxy-cis,cis-muconate cycloisomerase
VIGWSAHRLYGAWIGAPEIEAAFSPEADVAAMLRFEAALAQAEARHDVIPDAAAAQIAAVAADFEPDWSRLRAASARDGVAAPDLVAQLREAVGAPHAPWAHYGATSQDAIDTSLMMRLTEVARLLDARLAEVIERIDALDMRFGDRRLMALTRRRDALPISVRDRLALWRSPIAEIRGELARLPHDVFAVQLGGPVGVLDLGEAGPAIRAAMARRLGLADPGRAWHVDRRRVSAVVGLAGAVAAALGKIGADVALMAHDAAASVDLDGGGSSSMPHKVNPVDAELLIALAGHVSALRAGAAVAMVHEGERSGAAWTLEWLVLPQAVVAAGSAANAAARLLGAIRRMG